MSEPSAPPLSLTVGDRVVYPNQGVCRVSGIELKEVAGQKLTFVTMRREEDGALVMVPQQKVQSIGLRKVATAAEVENVFGFLKSDSDKANLDWKQRARTNTDRMNQGGIQGLAEVVKGLQVLSELRPLPTKERELYDTARHLLVSEIAASLGLSECDAEDSIDVILFPPGRERPKRTAEEFRPVMGDDDGGLELHDEMLDLDGDLELPPDEEVVSPDDEATVAAERHEAATARREAVAEADEEESSELAGGPAAEAPVKRKRGRPPKPKPEGAETPAAPKRRGRPPKPKAEVTEAAAPAVPKRRGRPPKSKPEGDKSKKP